MKISKYYPLSKDAGLTPMTKEEARECTNKIRDCFGAKGKLVGEDNKIIFSLRSNPLDTPESIFESGNLLMHMKSKLQPKEFKSWAKDNLLFNYSKVQLLLKVAEKFNGKSKESSNLTPSALYFIARKNLPYLVVNEVCKRSSLGELITLKVAKSIAFQCSELCEKEIEIALAAQLREQGEFVKTQVNCDFGVADIVSNTAIYEIKYVLNRDTIFQAVGQALLYRQSINPSARAVIVGIDGGVKDLIHLIKAAGVEVEFWKSLF